MRETFQQGRLPGTQDQREGRAQPYNAYPEPLLPCTTTMSPLLTAKLTLEKMGSPLGLAHCSSFTSRTVSPIVTVMVES